MLDIRLPDLLPFPSLASRTPLTEGAVQAFQLTHGERTRTVIERSEDLYALPEFRLSGATDYADALNAAIAALNAAEIKGFVIPPASFTLDHEAVFDPITADDIAIVGSPGASKLVVPAGAGDTSRIFQFGGPGNFSLKASITGLHIEYLNTPNITDAMIEGFLFNTLTLNDLIVSGHARLLHLSQGGLLSARNWKCTPAAVAGDTASIIYLGDVSTHAYDDIVVSNTGVPGNGDPAGKFMHLAVTEDGSVDTISLRRIHFQLMSDQTVATGDGRPYGVYLEKPESVGVDFDGSLTNIEIDGCVIDHTIIAGIKADVHVANSSKSRNWRINGTRIFSDRGIPIDLELGALDYQTGVRVTNSYVSVADDNPGISISGANGFGTAVLGNSVLDRNAATAKTSAIKMSGDNWLVADNVIDNDEGDAPGWLNAIEVVGVLDDNFTIGLNHAPRVPNYVKEPAYSAYSPTRTILSPERVQELQAAQRSTLRDNFNGVALDTARWGTLVGSDAQCLAPAVIAGQPGGNIRMTFGDDAGDTMALNGARLIGSVVWRPSNGGLVVELRAHLNVITTVAAFFGLVDATARDANSLPFTMSGTTLTSNAVDAVGVLFDTDATTDNFKLVGVANGVDAAVQDAGIAPVAGTFGIWTIKISDTGVATFYRNRVQIGTAMTGAVTPGTVLAFFFGGFSRSAATHNATIDYVEISQELQ